MSTKISRLLALLCLPLLLGGCMEEVAASVYAGGNLSAALTESGGVYLWGDARPYADESFNYSYIDAPTVYNGVGGIVSIAAGDGFALWLTRDGLFGTGRLDGLPLGVFTGERTDKPLRFAVRDADVTRVDTNVAYIDEDLSAATHISAGAEHALLLKADGTVWAWGMNALGQLGQGTAGIAIRSPVRVNGLEAVQSIAAGWDGCSAALDMSGHVWCWGGDESLAEPTVVEGLPDKVTKIAAGGDFWLALDADGTVWSWSLSDMTPIAVDTFNDVRELEAGYDFAAVLDGQRNVWTWGANEHGQLGRDTGGAADMIPKRVDTLNEATDISVGLRHAIAKCKDGTVRLWGANANGQLGNGGNTDSAVPLKLKGLK